MIRRNTQPAALRAVRVSDGFWHPRMEIIRTKTVAHQWDALNDRLPDAAPSHVISDLRKAGAVLKAEAAGAAGSESREAVGEFQGILFQDSDLAKWLETLSYRLTTHPDPKWESVAEEAINLLEAAQQDDGYLNTYFSVAKPEERWTNLRDCHELYVAGHLMEAAVAYFEATGRRRFLDMMCRFADAVDRLFGPEAGKRRGYPGHEEIELALVKLYRATGRKKYLDLSRYFLDERGREPHYFQKEAAERGEVEPLRKIRRPPYDYFQAHLPVREQTEAVGHAVRAMYLYSGMMDVALETGDQALADACRKLWENVTQRRMYVTGGVGSSSHGEAFTFDYDLPPDRAYTETCAAIGLVFWAHRMLQWEPRGEYADVMERALYNGVLSGISLDGQRYFYVNPLEVWPEACAKREDLHHVKVTRQPWFGCACCPPNISRLLASLGRYIYSASAEGAPEESLYVHLYVGSEASLELGGRTVRLVQETGYPWEEAVRLTVRSEETSAGSPAAFTLFLRMPGWCRDPRVRVNGTDVNVAAGLRHGYLAVSREWKEGDVCEMVFPMGVERIRSHPEVRASAGMIALRRGPLVYCLEEADNGPRLAAVRLPREAQVSARFEKGLLGGVTVLSAPGKRPPAGSWGGELYAPTEAREEELPLKAIPYYAWANREPGEMTVWIRE